MANRFIDIALGLSAALCVSPCQATEPKTVWAKTSVPAVAMVADLADCTANSKSTVAHAADAGVPPSLVGELLAEAIDTPGLRARAIRDCMHGRGYHAVPLTPQEMFDLAAKTLPADALDWLEGFYARPDFAGRLADSTPPPFPEAKTEPFTYGAVRLDPNSFVVASGAVARGGVLLSGVASHRGTGHLLRDLPVAQYDGGGRLPAGAVLSQAVFREADGRDRTYWCGVFKAQFESEPTCARSDGLSYRLVSSDGPKWLATGLDLHADQGEAEPDGFWLDESADDLIGPMQFALVLCKVTPTSIAVEATVTQGNDTETIWQDTLARGSDGSAVLPLWTRRLILTPNASSGVAISLTMNGDGSSWRYMHVPD